MKKINAREISDQSPAGLISLREAGRRLGIPPSTIVYYKDRFSRFLPRTDGQGRRKRYPESVLDTFREIRELYGRNRTTEEVEAYLEDRAAASGASDSELPARVQVPEPPAVAGAESGFSFMGILESLAGLARGQEALRGEIEELRREVALLRNERDDLVRSSGERVGALEMEVAGLRQENDGLKHHIGVATRPGGLASACPSRLFMGRPLVIQSQRGEYLGVAGRSRRHFTLNDLVGLLRGNPASRKAISMEWELEDAGWLLRIKSDGPTGATPRNLVFSLRETTTPNKNRVVELTSMVVDGNTVPRTMLLSLFKQIRESFA